jgi:hypothetical protein
MFKFIVLTALTITIAIMIWPVIFQGGKKLAKQVEEFQEEEHKND